MSESKKHALIAATVLVLSLLLGMMFNFIAGAFAHVAMVIFWISSHVLAGNVKEVLQEQREEERNEEVEIMAKLRQLGLEGHFSQIRKKSRLPNNIKLLGNVELVAVILIIVHSIPLIFAFASWVWTYPLFTFMPELVEVLVCALRAWHGYEKKKAPPSSQGMSSGVIMEPFERPQNDG